MINKKIKSIFMVMIVLLNMISPSTVVAAWHKSEIDNGIYVIESSVGRGKVLDICEAKKEDGANLQIWEASENLGNSLNQLFYIDRNEDGSYSDEVKQLVGEMNVK